MIEVVLAGDARADGIRFRYAPARIRQGLGEALGEAFHLGRGPRRAAAAHVRQAREVRTGLFHVHHEGCKLGLRFGDLHACAGDRLSWNDR